MKNWFILSFLAYFLFSFSPSFAQNEAATSEIDKLNERGYDNRLIDPEQTVAYGEKALVLAKKINYTNGIAEAYRVVGIGKYYQNQSDDAIENYLTSLTYFRECNNLNGEAKVYNNIGNLYRDFDFDKALEYFHNSLAIAEKLNLRDLIAGLHLNIGNIHQKKKNYSKALISYEKSFKLFEELDNQTGITQCLQNLGVTYHRLTDLDKSKDHLTRAIAKAKEHDFNFIVASANLTLSSVHIAQQQFKEAEKSIKEGVSYAEIVNDSKLKFDYLYTSYELENKKKNYQKALEYLKQVYTTDSINYNNNVSAKLGLQQEQFKQLQRQRENELTIEKQKNTQILFISSTIVAALLLVLTGVLVSSVRRKARSNKLLQELNQEISLQKEHVDRVNHNLEEIIEERTRDLKIKNRKLSEYSSHLSHQIRGPVATLKGLMLLEKDNLIDQKELVEEINKCVGDIDDKIININKSLNDANVPGFKVKA